MNCKKSCWRLRAGFIEEEARVTDQFILLFCSGFICKQLGSPYFRDSLEGYILMDIYLPCGCTWAMGRRALGCPSVGRS